MKAALLAIGMLAATEASGAELHIISQANVAKPLTSIIARFQRDTGNKVTITFGNPGVTLERLRQHSPADVVIVTGTILAKVEEEHLARTDDRVRIATGKIGIGAAATSPWTPFVDKAGFVKTLKQATWIALVDPAAGSGTSPPFIKAVEGLGLAPQISPKYKLFRGAGEVVADAVARGEADLAVTAVSELVPNTGVRILGAIPSDVLDWTITTYAMEASSPPKAPRLGSS